MGDATTRTVIITGAAGNLGRCVAQAFRAEGANLVLVDLQRDSLAKTFGTEDPTRLFAPANLLEQTQVDALLRAALARFGRIDVLCNLAGGFRMGEAVHETSDSTWDFLFDINARTLLHMVRGVVPHMLASGGGKIVNVGAFAAQRGQGQMGAYCAAKSSVIRLTESLAAELAREEHQRELRAAEHHRHAAEPRRDAGRRPRALGRAAGPGERDRLPRLRRGARDPRRGAARDRPELRPAARRLRRVTPRGVA